MTRYRRGEGFLHSPLCKVPRCPQWRSNLLRSPPRWCSPVWLCPRRIWTSSVSCPNHRWTRGSGPCSRARRWRWSASRGHPEGKRLIIFLVLIQLITSWSLTSILVKCLKLVWSLFSITTTFFPSLSAQATYFFPTRERGNLPQWTALVPNWICFLCSSSKRIAVEREGILQIISKVG